MRRVFGSGLEDISAHEAARVQERAFRSLRRYPQTIEHLETTGRARQERAPGGGLRGSATLAQGGQGRVAAAPMRHLKHKNRLLWGEEPVVTPYEIWSG
jgi:hypothetical protein